MKKSIPYIIIAFLLILLINQCSSSSNKNITQANYEALNDTVRYYKNRLGTETATIKTLQTDRYSLNALLLNKDKELKELTKEFTEVKNVVKYKTVTEIRTVIDSFTVPIPCHDFVRKGRVNKKHYSFTYKIDPLTFTLDSLHIPNETTVITGVKRKWFLGKQYVATDVTSSNPYVKTTDLKAYQMEVPNPIHKKWYVWLGAGVLTGVLISN